MSLPLTLLIVGIVLSRVLLTVTSYGSTSLSLSFTGGLRCSGCEASTHFLSSFSSCLVRLFRPRVPLSSFQVPLMCSLWYSACGSWLESLSLLKWSSSHGQHVRYPCFDVWLLSCRYESSGYEYTSASSPQTYTSYRQVYTSPPQQHSTQSSLFQSNQSYSEPDTSANPDSTIESGPSFSESLNRFKTASGHNAQVASWKSSRQQSSSSSHVQRRVEETRTMITQSSQKSYHIE